MTRLQWIIASIAAAIVALYISYYYRAPASVSILQTSLADFKLDMLYEKQPIVVQDRVADLGALHSAWFPRTQRLANTAATLPPPEIWRKNQYKVLILQPTDVPIEVYLYRGALTSERVPPSDATLVAIQLAKNQVLMIPYRMTYTTAAPAPAAAIGVHDLVTYFLPSAV